MPRLNRGIQKVLKKLDSGRCDSKPSLRRNDDLLKNL